MKKLLLGSAALTLFSLSVIIFQISCQKDTSAQTTSYTLPPATTSTLGGIIVGNGLSVTSNGTLSITASSGATQQSKILFFKRLKSNTTTNWDEIWTANYDGTNAQKINIIPPAGMSINLDSDVAISPDGQRVFFGMSETATGATHIYSCKVDGTNLTKVVDGSGPSYVDVGVAY